MYVVLYHDSSTYAAVPAVQARPPLNVEVTRYKGIPPIDAVAVHCMGGKQGDAV